MFYKLTVTEFSKKTGDYPSLSATDIKVLALTYQLERENVGSSHLKSEPDVKVNKSNSQQQQIKHIRCQHDYFVFTEIPVGSLNSSLLLQVKVCSTQRHPEAPDNIAGFHFPHKVRLPVSIVVFTD